MGILSGRDDGISRKMDIVGYWTPFSRTNEIYSCLICARYRDGVIGWVLVPVLI